VIRERLKLAYQVGRAMVAVLTAPPTPKPVQRREAKPAHPHNQYLMLMVDTKPVGFERPGVGICRVGAMVFDTPPPKQPGVHIVQLAVANGPTPEAALQGLERHWKQHLPWVDALMQGPKA